jgi:hypothetical protein
MKRFHRPFFALLLSLLLIGSQQAAFAHLLSHAQGRSSTAVAQYQDDHGSLDGAAETCTTCIAFAGVGGGALPTTATLPSAIFVSDSYLLPEAKSVYTRSVITSRARAPPVFL